MLSNKLRTTPTMTDDRVTKLAESLLKQTRLLQKYGEDIVRLESETLRELVGEVQIKLDELEERSVRRTQNIVLKDDGDEIYWLPHPDPEQPTPSPPVVPKTIGELRRIEARKLVECMAIYSLVNDAGVPSDEEFDILWDELRLFLGLPRMSRMK